ncbi:MAG: methyltransferase domain-containing protein [Candidatus Lokiarchaeota archaeon]|nr:methyltransferase domain-containing protein [Candidatus Lokiarchaeota archaeon]MBD3199269.1 methyltransferase domain-containing protein [Candidatus Lokiarchaeota archaeon]
MEKWKESEGKKVLKTIGIKESQKIVDFGFGTGIYTFLSSEIIGPNGLIYSIDKDAEKVDDLKEQIKEKRINNVRVIKNTEKISIPLEEKSIDVVFLFDILHLLNEKDLFKLISECSRILKRDGFVSYHVTHRDETNLEKIKNLMNQFGLVLTKEMKLPMFHWSWIEEGLILNFRIKE